MHERLVERVGVSVLVEVCVVNSVPVHESVCAGVPVGEFVCAYHKASEISAHCVQAPTHGHVCGCIRAFAKILATA